MRITDGLRAWADEAFECQRISYPAMQELNAIVDRIEAEHKRRMRQQSRDLPRAFAKYMRGVLADYEHGVKRTRMDATERQMRKGRVWNPDRKRWVEVEQ